MAVARFTQSAIEIQNILDAVQDQTIYDPATETADGLESADDKRNLNKLSMTDAEMQTLLNLLDSGGATDVSVQSKTVTPTTNQQVVTPDSGYDYLSQVTVEKIPYKEELNSAGGYTVTIG